MARQSRNTPQNLINTYGPVVKVRWSTYTNTEETAEEFEENKQAKPNTLYNYDIACLYLNDDPTITIYNLGRKFIPKQIIHSKNPFRTLYGHEMKLDPEKFGRYPNLALLVLTTLIDWKTVTSVGQ